MVEFAGWEMPIQYTSIIDEHMAVRQHAGAFDVSHMGDFVIRGKGAKEALNRLSTNDISAPVGRCVYTHLPDERAGILDDTIITTLGDDEYFMVPNAATTPKIRDWLERNLRGQSFADESMGLAAIAVQGPAAKDVVGQLTSADLSRMRFFWGDFARLDKINEQGAIPSANLLKGREAVNGPGPGIFSFLSRTGYTGEDGFEIVCENADAPAVWNAVLGKGKPFGLKPVGLGARDTLRLEKGLLLSGTDFDGSQTSLQTGPGWVIDWNHDFMGKNILLEQKASGSYAKLVCFQLQERGIPRHGYEILSEGRRIGTVTSGTLSPVLKKGVGMGYVPLAISKPGTRLEIMIRDTIVKAEIVNPPFVRRGLT